MKSGALFYCLGGLAIGLIIGFLIANAFSRNETPVQISSQTPAIATNNRTETKAEKLSQEEIKAAFASAENKKDDAGFQKTLALALYQYAKVQNDSSFFSDLQKLLERVNEQTKSADFEVMTALAEIYLISGREKNDSNSIRNSQTLYQKAVELKPDAIEPKLALASSYLFAKPAEPEKAERQLNLILKENPKNEIGLQLLISALIENNKPEAAAERIAELKANNANNPAIADLEARLAQKKIESVK